MKKRNLFSLISLFFVIATVYVVLFIVPQLLVMK